MQNFRRWWTEAEGSYLVLGPIFFFGFIGWIVYLFYILLQCAAGVSA